MYVLTLAQHWKAFPVRGPTICKGWSLTPFGSGFQFVSWNQYVKIISSYKGVKGAGGEAILGSI